MDDEERREAALDEQEIASLLIRWGHARDSGDWETLAACFHEDATIHISWISGPASEFVVRSRELAGRHRPGSHTKHLITGPWIRLNGTRAFSRCHVNLFIRSELGGHAVDGQAWFRFFDLLEKREGVWRLVRRTAVYEKDRLDLVDPRGGAREIFADMEIPEGPEATKYLRWWQSLSGRPQMADIVSARTPEEAALKETCEAWLAGS